MSISGSFAAPVAASIVGLVVTPVAAHFSDRHGRMPIMLGGACVLLLASYPAFLLIRAYPTVTMLSAMIVLLGLPRMIYTAPLPAVLAEMFPVEVRVAGMSLAYTLGVIAFGGFAAFIIAWLIDVTGDVMAPAYYLAVTTAISVAALVAIRARFAMYF
jgi:MHS family proline/betaine transporter-like MFS transporter